MRYWKRAHSLRGEGRCISSDKQEIGRELIHFGEKEDASLLINRK
jgi:hypothetical protein